MKKTKQLLLLLTLVASLIFSYSGYTQTPIQQNPGGWEPVEAITDEFNGASLNLNKWKFGHPWWKGRSPLLFGDGRNAYLENGKLMMEVTLASGRDYLRGGAIHTVGKTMKEGMYIESRYRASGLRIGSGFWIVNNDLDADRRADEVDIQEAFGGINARTQHNTNVHNPQPNFTNDQPQPKSFTIPNGGTVSGEAHTYGLWWVNSRTIRFYLDGKLQRELRTNSTLEPMYALLNTETYNFMPPPTRVEVNGSIDPKYIKRAAFEYIRAWKPRLGGPTPGPENITLTNISNQTPGSAYTFQVNYTANQQRDVQVEVRAPNNDWLGLGKATVNGGSGTVNVTVNLNSAATVGNGYKATSLLVPVGSDWTQQIKTDSKTFNVVTTGSNPPVGSGDSFYIVNRQTQKKIRPQTNADASKILQVASNTTDNNVKWEQVNTSNGYFYLKNVQTGKYFRPSGDNNGDDLEQRPTSYSGNYTQWKKVNTSNGYFYLQNRQTGMYFRPTGNNNNDIMIQRPTSYSGNYTQWTFQSANSKSFNEAITTNFDVVAINKKGAIDLNIESSDIGLVNVRVFNVSGKSIYSDSFSTLSNHVIVRLAEGTIASGLYIAKVNINGKTKTVKFSL